MIRKSDAKTASKAKSQALTDKDLEKVTGGAKFDGIDGSVAGQGKGFTAPGDVAGVRAKPLADKDLDKVSGGFKVEIEGVTSFDEADSMFGKPTDTKPASAPKTLRENKGGSKG